MLNRYPAPEMYRHLLNGYAWIKDYAGWKRITPVMMVAAKKIDKQVYPLHYRTAKREAPGTIIEETPVVSSDEKYWRLGEVVIYKGDDLNQLVKEQPWQEESD